MNHKIHDTLLGLAVHVDSLLPLQGNPRISDVEAIAASLDEFGQLKPVVVRDNGDGSATIIAGNHTVEAARLLGWDYVAAVNVADFDEKRALTFALTDNRINELGSTDPALLHQAIASVSDEYNDYLEYLGWDEFELAALDEQYDTLIAAGERETGYIAPVLIEREAREMPTLPSSERKSEPSNIQVPEGVDQHEAVTRGSTSVGHGGTKAIVQYTLVFDTAEQQRKWYDFLRWLRTDAGTEGDTTAERLLYFLDAHANY